jgi:hypothetical protein
MEVKRKMGNKNKGKYRVQNHSHNEHHSASSGKRNRFSNGVRVILALAFLAVIAVAFSFAVSSQQPQVSNSPSTSGYPQSIAPATFSNPTITADGTKASIPKSYVDENKLVFVDLKLEQKTNTLEYQGRTIPLAYYRNGDYLPLVVISTPSGNTVTGIRVCEPCGSFSFHIVQGKYLRCDVCGTQWNLDNFADSSGGCTTYPPPKLTATVSDNVEIDLSSLQTIVTA